MHCDTPFASPPGPWVTPLHPCPVESDPFDLEELLRERLVPWVSQKLKGKAPPEVCRWLLGLVAQHEETTVVTPAEDALLQFLAEDGQARDRAALFLVAFLCPLVRLSPSWETDSYSPRGSHLRPGLGRNEYDSRGGDDEGTMLQSRAATKDWWVADSCCHDSPARQ